MCSLVGKIILQVHYNSYGPWFIDEKTKVWCGYFHVGRATQLMSLQAGTSYYLHLTPKLRQYQPCHHVATRANFPLEFRDI
jgi:hypothetical protein